MDETPEDTMPSKRVGAIAEGNAIPSHPVNDERGRIATETRKTRRSSLSQGSEGSENDNAASFKTKKIGARRTRKVSDKVAECLPIPRTMAAFSEADKTMWEMRKTGKGWEEIRAEWERITGQRVAATTLPNRYVRIKENIGDFNEDDDELLLRCKQELENTFSEELWCMISESMTAKGGNKFSAVAIQKRFKQLCGDLEMDP